MNPLAWLKRDVVDLPRAQITRLVAIDSNGARVALRRSDSRGFHVSAGIAGDDLAGDPMLRRAAGALQQLQFDDVHPVETILERAREDGETVVGVDNGLEYRIAWLSDEGRLWSVFSATVADPNANAVARKAARFNARHEKWAYRLPMVVAQQLRINADDLHDLQRLNSAASPEADPGGR